MAEPIFSTISFAASLISKPVPARPKFQSLIFKGDAFNDATRARGRRSTAVATRSDSNAREISEGPKFRPFHQRFRRRGFVLELKGTRRVILVMSCLGLYLDFGG